MSESRSKLDLINTLTLNITRIHIDALKLKEYIDELKTNSSGIMGEQDKAIDCVAQALHKAKEQDSIIDMLLKRNAEMSALLIRISEAYKTKDIGSLENAINDSIRYTNNIII